MYIYIIINCSSDQKLPGEMQNMHRYMNIFGRNMKLHNALGTYILSLNLLRYIIELCNEKNQFIFDYFIEIFFFFLQHNIHFLQEVLQNRRSDLLEWVIIVLLIMENFLSVYELIRESSAGSI